MKTTFIIFVTFFLLSFAQQNNVAWKSSVYMIINDYGAKNHSKTAYISYTESSFAFYTKESGLQYFSISENSRKVVKGFPEITYMSPDMRWMVIITPPKEIQVFRMMGFPESFVFHSLKLYDSDYNSFINTYTGK